MIKSVAFCHRRNVVHRDIKPENILVNVKKNYELKLCDFGFSRMIPNGYKGEPEYEGGKMTEYVATRWYRSPELLLGYTSYGPDVDLWAIGCMMAEMSDKEPLFPGDSEMDMLTLIQKSLGKMTPTQMESFKTNPRFMGMHFPDLNKKDAIEKRYMGKLSTKALDLLTKLLKMDPKERITGA